MTATMPILMVDDDPARIERVVSWMPPDVRVVGVQRAGAAVAIFHTSGVATAYAGIMLDYDLVAPRFQTSERALTGLDVARRIIQVVEVDTPVLVHSMSLERDQAINMLRTAGFPVTQIPFAELTKENLNKWSEEVRERWAYYHEAGGS